MRLLKVSRIQRTDKEDHHYVIVSYPGDHYVDHVAPKSGKSDDITTEILSVVHETNSVDTLGAVLCDSTNVNTGEHNGVIRQLEIALKRPVQSLICTLHLNELPFCEVFKTVDGPTSGPRGFKGPVGAALNFEPCDLPIVGFKAVPGETKDVADDIKADLSDDQSYLLQAVLFLHDSEIIKLI